MVDFVARCSHPKCRASIHTKSRRAAKDNCWDVPKNGAASCPRHSKRSLFSKLDISHAKIEKFIKVMDELRVYLCPRCQRLRSWSDGAHDDYQELCDSCYSKVSKKP